MLAAYNNNDKNELLSILSFTKTFFEAASSPLSDFQKLNHVVSQLTGKSRVWFAEAHLRDNTLRYDFYRFANDLLASTTSKSRQTNILRCL